MSESGPTPDATPVWDNIRLIFRAFKSRNYALFYAGQGVSLIGTWMQRIALAWLVYRLTGSALMLGIVSFAAQIPTFIIAPFGGVLVDRVNKYRLIVAMQVLASIQALTLAALVLTNTITVWEILVLSIFYGVINAFEIPARQSFVIQMVERREDLPNAIALNSSLVNIARMLGPTIAGVLIAAVGEGFCFLLNGLSYVAIVGALLAMRLAPYQAKPQEHHVWHAFKDGVRYAFGFAPIRSILLLMSLISLMGMPYVVLMPIFAKEVFHGGSRTLGFLMASPGAGALCGALYLASRKSVRGLGTIIPKAAIIFGGGLIAFSLSGILPLAMLLLFLTGFGMMVHMASCNTMLQTIVEDDKRGRVMAFYTMAFMGMAPFGSLMAGSLADVIGAGNTILFGGGCCIVGGLLFLRQLPALRELIRPIYAEKGIL